MIDKNNIQNIYTDSCAFFHKGFSNAATFRVWLMVKRDLSVDGIGLFSTSDDPFDIEFSIVNYYCDFPHNADINWGEIAEQAIEWSELDYAAQDVGC